MSKKIGIIVGLILVVSVLAIVSAQPANYYEAAHLTGVIIQSGTNAITATVDLGNIQSGSEFIASGNGSITIAETEGLNITNIIMEQQNANYWCSRFYSFVVNFTIDGNTWSAPMIANGIFNDTNWYSWNYVYWSSYHLNQGIHTITFTVYGKTQFTFVQLSIDTGFYLVLSEIP